MIEVSKKTIIQELQLISSKAGSLGYNLRIQSEEVDYLRTTVDELIVALEELEEPIPDAID